MDATILWGILVRTGQTAIESSSTILVGFLVAAVMRRMLGAEGTRKLFGGEGIKGLLRAWVIGVLLPVCSLGVIPVVREMRRSGVPVATILAFLLAAPQLNPLSFLYGLTLSEPVVILSFVAATMVLAILGGELWKRIWETESERIPQGDEPMPVKGVKRLLSVALTASRETVGPTLPFLAVGIVFTGLMAGLIPHGALSLTMRHDQWQSPLLMALIGLPAYSGVLPGMMRIGLIFDHGNSVGAAFVLFELGVGMNAGLLAWLFLRFGWRRIGLWLVAVVLLTLTLGYAMEPTLYFAKEEASHTHAFDDWTAPFPSGTAVDPPFVWKLIADKIEVLEPIALILLSLMAVIGLLLPKIVSTASLETWLTTESPTPAKPRSSWDVDVPGPVLGLTALAILIVVSFVGLYIYYPDAPAGFQEIVKVRADAMVAVQSGNKEEAIRQLRLLDLLTRKVQVGVFLRTMKWDPRIAALTEDYREQLESIRDALLADDQVLARKLGFQAEAGYRAFKAAFLEGVVDPGANPPSSAMPTPVGEG